MNDYNSDMDSHRKQESRLNHNMLYTETERNYTLQKLKRRTNDINLILTQTNQYLSVMFLFYVIDQNMIYKKIRV